MRTMLKGMLVLLLMVVFGLVPLLTYAGYDYTATPKPARDIFDALQATPTATLNEYGHNDRTKLVYNIIWWGDKCRGYEARIKTLEKEVALLSKSALQELRGVVDPNEVEE